VCGFDSRREFPLIPSFSLKGRRRKNSYPFKNKKASLGRAGFFTNC
jgi:CRISPR/Cas system CSM-associated protein Csm3 (group 7 of RAMP superfamily)